MEGASQTLAAVTLAEALEEAREWARDGSWDTSEGTVWVSAYVIELEDGEESGESHTVSVTIEPDEPTCTESEHDWQSPLAIVGGIKENPGVWGHGGGIIMHEVCIHCGCEKITDTWAQDHDTGEQGLTSTRYDAGKYAAEVAALAESEDCYLGELTYEKNGHHALPIDGRDAIAVQCQIDALRERGAHHIRWSRNDNALVLVEASELRGLGERDAEAASR
jgi:hypothetical protein